MVNSHIVSWKSTKQSTVSLSTTEAEYKALTDAGKETCWIINLTKEIGIHTKGINPPIICIDNRGALDLAQSEISQNGFCTKHMDLWLHFVRKILRQNIVQMKYVTSQSNQADFLTKPVGQLIIRRTLYYFTKDCPQLSASRPDAPSTGGCQVSDLVKTDPVGTEPFSQMYDELVADALDQASPSHDTASQHA
ncbi:hypothetical protein PCANC_11685 [Puccinia coronata f. sp. avenae]|uniref:Reverse transcriptase Ty1/copia-type domain-containing protein n=1 Tax=Puccinia coronata f. sp. avenae TaxID=200324 RepID=A0A2N5VXH1_9BASI|nr:hypothetical protein PCANC_11685 [Puccinia coronata f. sp. avenae]